MEDTRIVDLYWQRDESAMRESEAKYGAYCQSIAMHVLNSREDAEECVNDTWLRAWNSIPPQRPVKLSLFLGKIVRNLAIDKYRRNGAARRGGGQMQLCLEELEECVGKESVLEERMALRDAINAFLRESSGNKREIFLMRYWYMMSVHEIARRCKLSEGSVKMTLSRARVELRAYLAKEGLEL